MTELRIAVNTTDCHPADVWLLEYLGRLAERIAETYELELTELGHLPTPAAAGKLGVWHPGGRIAVSIRVNTGRDWRKSPRSLVDVLSALAHELAHCEHAQHTAAHQELTVDIVNAMWELNREWVLYRKEELLDWAPVELVDTEKYNDWLEGVGIRTCVRKRPTPRVDEAGRGGDER